MTKLEQAAMEIQPVPRERVERLYAATDNHGAYTFEARTICESHERLRAELDAAQVVLKAARVIIDELHTDAKSAEIQWWPIADAPKDKFILLWHADIGWCEGHWSHVLNEWAFGLEEVQPTHFAIVTGPEVGA